MRTLSIHIVRFVNESQPGWLECEFLDANGRKHTLIDKVPVFLCEDLDRSSQYPRPGTVRCEVISQWRDNDGRELARISTARPDGVDSTEGLSEFVVFCNQLS